MFKALRMKIRRFIFLEFPLISRSRLNSQIDINLRIIAQRDSIRKQLDWLKKDLLS